MIGATELRCVALIAAVARVAMDTNIATRQADSILITAQKFEAYLRGEVRS